MQESAIALEWLYTTLSEDDALLSYAPGGVWRALAPDGTTTPFVIIAFQSGMDVLSMNVVRLMTDVLFQVKVVGPALITSQLFNAADEIDTLLKRASGTVTGGTVLACYRESPLQLDELVNGEVWSNIGGLYRAAVQQS